MGGAGGGGDRLRRRVDTVAIASPSTSVEVRPLPRMIRPPSRPSL
jgi:hypothetical protein